MIGTAMAIDDPVVVVPYDPSWPDVFEAEANKLRSGLGSAVVDVHHIGSTAVPGMAAKPIIDILVVVRDIVDAPLVMKAMESSGFTCYGDFGVPGRKFYRREGIPPLHVHLFSDGHPSIERDLNFRDILRRETRIANEYAEVKIELVGKFHGDRPSYSRAKEEFIARIAGPRPMPRTF